MRRAFGPVFIAAGILHFLRPEIYEAIVPDVLPAKRALVLASGVTEIVGGAATMHPRTRALSWPLNAATLIGVFPANVHMAMHPERYRSVPGGRRALIARLPLQLAFLAWARAAAR